MALKHRVKTSRISILIFVCLTQTVSWAAIERKQAGREKKHQYISSGKIIGGEASGSAHTLLDMRRILAPKDKIERLILDLGSDKGSPLKNRVSYFQISVEKDKPRVVIELSQMLGSGVDQKKLQQIFKSSPAVKLAKINYDPVDTTISIQLELKKQTQVEAFQLLSADKASRIVIDLKEIL